MNALNDIHRYNRGMFSSYRNLCLGLFMLDAGLRVGEVVSLTWQQLYFGTTLGIGVEIDPASNHCRNARTVPLSKRLAKAITDYANYPTIPLFADAMNDVFKGQHTNKPMTTRHARRIIQNAGMDAIGRRVHPHMLRHTFATRLMRTTSTRILQELLGHSNLSSTQVYTHPNSGDLLKAIDSLEELK